MNKLFIYMPCLAKESPWWAVCGQGGCALCGPNVNQGSLELERTSGVMDFSPFSAR